MKPSKDSQNENFSLEWSPYPPEPLIRPDKKRKRGRDLKRRLVPGGNKEPFEIVILSGDPGGDCLPPFETGYPEQ